MVSAAELYERERIINLLVRYWGMGTPLMAAERDILLAALDAENKALRAPIHLRALERLKDKGIA